MILLARFIIKSVMTFIEIYFGNLTNLL